LRSFGVPWTPQDDRLGGGAIAGVFCAGRSKPRLYKKNRSAADRSR
jgi:hypothetical protein